jgi:peptidyl-prolyl cis-trans isomerase SurA
MTRRVQLGRMILLCLGLLLPIAATAQSPFSPEITVNDDVITGYELEQRIMLLTFFNSPGDLPVLARKALVEDRLRRQELDRVGVSLTLESEVSAIEDFAQRGNLTTEQLVTVLTQNGIDEETLRDFVLTGVAWRDYVRSLYLDRVTVTDQEINDALALSQTQSSSIQVLLNEIIIAAPANQPAVVDQAKQAATEISQFTTTAAFEAAAREVSAVPSKEQGGRLDWTEITRYPPVLGQLLLTLEPGQVTPPIEIDNGIALLQMRGVREGGFTRATPASIDYAIYHIPGGRTPVALAIAQEVANSVDDCGDLYAIARGQPPEMLDRIEQSPSEIPPGIALEIAKLDPGETSWTLTSTNGDMLLFLMVCSRNQPLPAETDIDALRRQLVGEKLGQYAEVLLQQLRANALIIGE